MLKFAEEYLQLNIPQIIILSRPFNTSSPFVNNYALMNAYAFFCAYIYNQSMDC